MRLLWLNLFVAFFCLTFVDVRAGEVGINNAEDFTPTEFKRDLKNMMLKHFNLSLKYLYTGVGYGSASVQRPGMAKYLRELSDSHWNDGLELMHKFFSRGGKAIDLYMLNLFHFEAKNELEMTADNTLDMRVPYLATLEKLHEDSKTCAAFMNKLHQISVGQEFHDADWGHYFEEKVEKEEERRREMIGHVTNLQQMFMSSLGLHIFDSHL